MDIREGGARHPEKISELQDAGPGDRVSGTTMAFDWVSPTTRCATVVQICTAI